ncbi:MAG: hypothetical protein M1826_000958 [Phylliscum demangeonii]|nr:MAG: hypothetical protein M1826_000958 [Phylliscum demangeonii]
MGSISRSLGALALLSALLVTLVLARPIEDPHGPWSSRDPPAYRMPNLGPIELEPHFFDQFAHAELLTPVRRDEQRMIWREDRKAALHAIYERWPDEKPSWRESARRRKALLTRANARANAAIRQLMGDTGSLEVKLSLRRAALREDEATRCKLEADLRRCKDHIEHEARAIREMEQLLAQAKRNNAVRHPHEPNAVSVGAAPGTEPSAGAKSSAVAPSSSSSSSSLSSWWRRIEESAATWPAAAAGHRRLPRLPRLLGHAAARALLAHHRPTSAAAAAGIEWERAASAVVP